MNRLPWWCPRSVPCGCVLAVLAAIVLCAPLSAQNGILSGTVVDEESGAPVNAAAVEVTGGTLGQAQGGARGVFTDATGRFRLTLPPGSYTLVISNLGYGTERIDGVDVNAGETREVTVQLPTTALLLNPLVVTASRREEKALDAPAAVSIVPRERIRSEVALTPVEYVKGVKGLDVVQTGLQQSNVVARGFNNVFSGALLVLTDNRYAHVPSLRFNAYNMIPLTNRDVERVEVVLGPGAALYGPNSASGVMHIITTSPIDDPGTSVSFASGFRGQNAVESEGGSVFHGTFRHAASFDDRLGIKVSGQWFRGDDWRYVDPFEQIQKELREAQAPDDPRTARIADRLEDAERWGGEARVDWRPWNDGEVILNGGVNRLVESIELTGLGAGQARDWTYSYVQTRLRKGRLFAQAFLNASDAGETYLLRTGENIVDESRMWVGQVQHGADLGDRQSFTYGVDLQRTEPRTAGTITGSNEDDDVISEVGGYVHSETNLTDRVDLVAALRLDWHSRLPDPVVSPRAAIVFHPTPEQNFRLTFNRAFSTPTTNNLFLDLRAGSFGIPPGGSALFSYDIRTFGVPETGFTFNEQCTGGIQGHCMRSPLPGAPPGPLPATATPFWNGLVEALATLDPSLEPLVPALRDPGDAGDPALASALRTLDFQEAQKPRCSPDVPAEIDCHDPAEDELFRLSDGPEAIPRLTSTITNTLEVGYKGLIGSRILVSADVYRSDIEDFVGPLRVETPNVFLAPQETFAFIKHRLVTRAGMGEPQADATAQALTASLAEIPVGTVTPDGRENSDLIVTYKNFGDMTFWGADLGAEILATDRWSFSGTLSWLSEECMDFDEDGDCTGARDISLNAPGMKGSLGVRFRDVAAGWTAGARARMTDGYIMNSGAYVGDVGGYTVVDLDVSYDLRWVSGASATLSINNAFDELHSEFVGAPELGRLSMLRLTYAF